ncbi:MAG: YeeE/YedE family protein [Burkholderiaceae bacterium]|nr:YeeE/YedE family protein [Burkholderiaceae bacterium]
MAASALPAPAATTAPARRAARPVALYLLAAVAALAVTLAAGLRAGLLFAIGVGFGAALAAVSFGFTTGWRIWIRERDPTGFLAQLLLIGLAMMASIPLLATHPELSGAYAPLSVSLVLGAFVFGAAMQVADGCGSGSMYKAGMGNLFNLAVLPGFIAGSFLGAAHLDTWLALGSLPPVSLIDSLGAGGALTVQLAALAAIAALLWRARRATGVRWRGKGVYVAAVALAVLAVLNLIVAGQPWGIVYGLGLWGAKIATWAGWDLAANAFWGRPEQQAQITAPLLDDVTSVTNLGLLAGALIASVQRGTFAPHVQANAKQWIAAVVTGLVLGYSARLAFGCNIGAYFAGISTGSVHGWVWFAAAFAGSVAGVRLREKLGLKG